jgi:hypothetical protein
MGAKSMRESSLDHAGFVVPPLGGVINDRKMFLFNMSKRYVMNENFCVPNAA